jgi:cation diffusion facilitator CzcD-associated flavoprotein CzcO
MARRGRRSIGIIGAGPGGIAAAVRLLEAGHDDVVLLEKASGVGGTWWHNRYPGLSCDIPSHLYSFSFAPKLDWKRPYGGRDEIHAYMDGVVDQFELRDRIRFDTEVTRAKWDDARALWRVDTASGDTFEFDVVVAGLGMFNELNWPDIPGLDSFGGTQFHSARWDWDHDLAGERVGVIGSAASAVQFIPEIAPLAGQLTVFQRAANWVLPKEDTPWTEEQLEFFATHPEEVEASRQAIFDRVDPLISFSNAEMLRLSTEAGLRNLEAVEDPDLRRRLTPTGPYGCQRPLISNDYYPTFNRPNVELVTEPIERITPAGVATVDGVEREFDTLIIATGFQTTKYLSAIDVTGRDGLHLDKAWADGAHAYLGITTAGFPNLFMLYGPNTNNGSIIYMLECQAEYAAQAVEWIERDDLAWIDVKPEVETEYNERLQHDLDTVGVWGASNCHNYYRGAGGHIVTQWPHSMSEYRRRTERLDPDAYLTFVNDPA